MLIKSKLLGATLIVAGTTIGASMLALPLVSSSLGIINSMLLLLVIWFLGYYMSIVVLNINSFYNGAFSISELCKKAGSFNMEVVANVSIITLFYALLAAYMSGIVDICLTKGVFHQWFESYMGYVVICALVFLIVIDFKVLDLGNRIIFFAKIIVFLTLLLLLMPHIDNNNINYFNNNFIEKSNLYLAIPVFFTSFGFHGSIPFIIKYLDCDKEQVKKAFFRGSLMSLVMYFLWVLFTISTLPQHGDISFDSVGGDSNIADFITALTNVTNQSSLSIAATLFSCFAIITSFLGVGVGLYDYFLEKLSLDGKLWINKIKAGAISFAPPMVVAVTNQGIFVKALAFAAISLSMIAVVLPSLIALQISTKHRNNNAVVSKSFFTPCIVLALIMGLVIIVLETLNFLR
jgi:tyrosine-specific transport protein